MVSSGIDISTLSGRSKTFTNNVGAMLAKALRPEDHAISEKEAPFGDGPFSSTLNGVYENTLGENGINLPDALSAVYGPGSKSK